MNPYQTIPFLLTPNPAADNGPAIRDALAAGRRWIQINGNTCPIGTRVDFNDPVTKAPYHNVVIEPAPGIGVVTCDVSGIGRDLSNLTNTLYSAFDYQGDVRPASYLSAASGVNTTQVYVQNASLYSPGEWVVISDMSTNPSATLLPLDGPMEVRQILYRLADSLIFSQALKRAHPLNAVVCKITPLRGLVMRGLRFTGDCSIAIHGHFLQGCTFSNIKTDAWTGRCMLLLDYGGSNNLTIECFCEGTVPGAGVGQSAWGVAFEGQDNTRSYHCGGTHCGNGHTMNYCIDTMAVEALAYYNNVNVNVHFASLRSGFINSSTAYPVILDYAISSDCVDCYIHNPQP